MLVTNEDIKIVNDMLSDLTIAIMRHPDRDKVKECMQKKSRLCALKTKLLKEFTNREFPEMKDAH